MKRSFYTGLLVILSSMGLSAHDLYLKLDNYFVNPQEKISVKILNGSF